MIRNGRKRRIMAVLAVLLLLFIMWSLQSIFHGVRDESSVSYGAAIYQPLDSIRCPGETLTFDYVLERKIAGPVEIVQSWCRVSDGVCALGDSVVRYGNIARVYPPLPITSSRTIPDTALMKGGDVWEYIHSVHALGQNEFDMYTVPFTIAEHCN